eukprot:1148531-Pelagomonas_calceolata.AAC.2
MVEVSLGGVLRASLSSGLTFWVEDRTLACVDVWIECIGEAVLALYLECVCSLDISLWGSVAPVIFKTCCARTGRACYRSWPRPDSGWPWEATSGDLMPEVSWLDLPGCERNSHTPVVPSKIPPQDRDMYLVEPEICPDTNPYITFETAATQHAHT